MDWKLIIGKFIKGAVGGAGTIIAAESFTGQINWKSLLIGIGTGAFHAGWAAIAPFLETKPTT